MKQLQNFNKYKMFYFKWNSFYCFENDRILTAFSETFRLLREVTTWEHDAIQDHSPETWQAKRNQERQTKRQKGFW
jgi:hypothetical protein